MTERRIIEEVVKPPRYESPWYTYRAHIQPATGKPYWKTVAIDAKGWDLTLARNFVFGPESTAKQFGNA